MLFVITALIQVLSIPAISQELPARDSLVVQQGQTARDYPRTNTPPANELDPKVRASLALASA
jgi:hypothetical protein